MTKRYRLYIMYTDAETLAYANKQRFQRVTPRYTLIYKRGKADHAAELTQEEVERLSDADAQWLLDCNMQLLREEAAKEKPKTLQRLGEMVSQLEAALQDELRKRGESDGKTRDTAGNERSAV